MLKLNKSKLKLFYIIFVLFIISLILFFISEYKFFTTSKIESGTALVEINDLNIKAKLRITPEERSKGLSGKTSLANDEGMLFVFSKAGIYPFWMYDMNFPIDIIWILDDRVVEIWENAPPPDESGEVPIYRPKSKANYVLEINAGLSDKYNIKINDKVNIKYEKNNKN